MRKINLVICLLALFILTSCKQAVDFVQENETIGSPTSGDSTLTKKDKTNE